MFVDKWEPGIVPKKPELTSAPIWLELRKVPFQFFNEDGLERIAGLVGEPKFLHPATANKTNLEVAKVFTVIDPRKPLPEAVNVQFQSGEICRVLVSSPWMPPVCEVCKEVGHASKRCPSVAKVCSHCKSKAHATVNCPKKLKTVQNQTETTGKKTRRSRSRSKGKTEWRVVENASAAGTPTATPPAPPDSGQVVAVAVLDSKLGTEKDKVTGEPSGTPSYLQVTLPRSVSRGSRSSNSDIQHDSSDVETSDSEMEEGEISKQVRDFEEDFTEVHYKKKFSGRKGSRGRGPKAN